MPANNYPSYRDTINRIGICLCIMLALIQGTSLAWALLSGWLSVILPAESAYFTGVLIETVSYLSYFIIPAVLFVPLSNGRERQPVRFDIRMPASFPLLILAGLAAISAAAQVNAWLMTLIGYTTDMTASYDFPAPQTGSAPVCTRQSFRKSSGVASSRTAHETGFSHCFP